MGRIPLPTEQRICCPDTKWSREMTRPAVRGRIAAGPVADLHRSRVLRAASAPARDP